MEVLHKTVPRLRIEVEPVNVELDSDGGILWTALQTAFPGCSGLYYKDHDHSKNSVQFDGKKFVAPGGNWDQNRFYVTLTQATGSYSDATKQFERNVQAVQKMLAACQFKNSDQTRIKKKPVCETPIPSFRPESVSPTQVPDPIHSIQERSEQLKSSGRDLTPIEQQFVDLARISTAKDQIIDSHRSEITRLEKTIRNMQSKIDQLEASLSDASALTSAQEEELRILRKLGKEYGESVEKVLKLNLTTKKLEEVSEKLEILKSESEKTIEHQEERIKELSKENHELNEKLLVSNNRINELTQNVQVLETTKELLSNELNQLRPLSDTIGIQEMDSIPTYVEAIDKSHKLKEDVERLDRELHEVQTSYNQLQGVYDPLAQHNRNLTERNEVLEQRVARIDEDLQKLNEEWAKSLKERQSNWNDQKEILEEEAKNLRDQVHVLQQIVDSATREAAEQARRRDELKAAAREIPRSPKLATSLKF